MAGDRLVRWLATAGGCGLAPAASGTVGTLPGIALAGAAFLAVPAAAPALVLLLAALVTALAVPVATAAERAYGRKDDGRIVIDEVAGALWALAGLTVAGGRDLALALAAGFLLFRLFDIWKPFPVRRLQSLPGGWGVVLDDVLAGLYANLAVRLVLHLVG